MRTPWRARPGKGEAREGSGARPVGPPRQGGGGGLCPHPEELRLQGKGARHGGHRTPSAERVRGDETLRGTRGSQSARRADHPSALFRFRLEPVVFEDERRDVDPPETRGGPGSSPVFRPKSYPDVREDRRGSRLRPLGSPDLGPLPRELPGLCLPGRNGSRGCGWVPHFPSETPSDPAWERGPPGETPARSVSGRPQGRRNAKEAHANIPRLS